MGSAKVAITIKEELLDQIGYTGIGFTEHHFHIEGFSPATRKWGRGAEGTARTLHAVLQFEELRSATSSPASSCSPAR